MFQFFGYLSGALIAVEFIPYIRGILHHDTRPQRTTWLIYSVLGVIAFFSQAAKGASYSLMFSAVITVGVTTVFLLSIKYGAGGFKARDHAVLAISALGLIGWRATNEAAVALYTTIVIDIAATTLTIEKAYRHPASETLLLWILSALGGICAMVSVGQWNIVLLSYPFTIALVDSAVIVAILLGRKKIAKRSSNTLI